MLREHCDALEADLDHYHRVNLVDLYRGRISLRKVAAFAAQLPQGARVHVEESTDAAWTEEAHLIAELIDTERAAIWQRAGDNNKPKPKPFPRPPAAKAQRDQEKTLSSQAQLFRERQQRRAELLEAATPAADPSV